MPTRSDQELARASIDGDRRAFGELIDGYQKRIYNLALRVTGSTDDALDVTQAAFLKAYESLTRFDPERPFSSWIYRIALNEALTLVGRRRSTQLDVDLPSPANSPEKEAASRETTRAIQIALGELKTDHRVMIVLRHFEGFSYLEMSEIVGIPEKTIKSRLFSARRELRAMLVGKGLL
jgi:RNA polymerase sigma-70 factor (ECF subfamily)